MHRLKVVYQSPRVLTENARNSRTHSAGQIDQIAKSITSFGFITPVLVDTSNQIIAGHGRVRAAKKLGLEKVPTISVEHLTEAQKRAFVIADNRLAELSGWDEQMLGLEFEELSSLEAPFEITDTGFELPKIDVLIEDLHKPEDKHDPADDPVAPSRVQKVAQLGDLWLLGRHALFVGDALDARSYPALLGRERAQMVFVDPPYNVPIQGHVSGLGKARHDEFVMASGEMSSAEFESFLQTTFQRLVAASIDGAIHFVFMDWRGLKELLAAAAVYAELKNVCCWVKAQGGMGSLYRSQHELIAVFKSGTARHINNVALGRHGRNRTNVWSMPGMNSFQRNRAEKLAMHPTVKPVALVADAILDCSNRGGLILDVFGGSGTTIIAAERTGRRAAVMELNPHFADVTLRRFCDVTGIEPVNAWTGERVRRLFKREKQS
jgi:16S rRNA G966 N2-methylase RsmD